MAGTIDDRVLSVIEQNPEGITFKNIQARLQITTANFRDLDKALQRLRRKGKIFYFNPVVGWKPGSRR